MDSNKKTIFIKMFGVTIAAAITTTAAFYYFNTDVFKAYSVLMFTSGMLIFGISLGYGGAHAKR